MISIETQVAEQLASAADSDVEWWERAAPGEDAVVAGRVMYQGRAYYALGRVVRGRTQWDDTVEPIATRDGAMVLVAFRDGSRSFWAARSEVQVVKTYARPTTIAQGHEDGIPEGSGG